MSLLPVSPRAAKKTKNISLNAMAVLIAVLTLFPIFWMVSTAFKPSQEIYSLMLLRKNSHTEPMPEACPLITALKLPSVGRAGRRLGVSE